MSINPSPSNLLTISALTSRVMEAIRKDPTLDSVWAIGEISNFTHHGSGHMYFALKDDECRIKAVMFKSSAQKLKFVPSNGLKVIAHGRVDVYHKLGEYQIYVDHMEPQGIGELFRAFEALKARLQSEGLFDPAVKRPIPGFPRRIGVITSPTGAALRDIITVAKRRYTGINILVIPALVQGVDAPASIVWALEAAQGISDLDCLIIGRGGGSIEELWAFNDESLARAIRRSRIPVISAVGHETDFTIADFAADLRAPTPSAAAEILVPNAASLRREIGLKVGKTERVVRMILSYGRDRVVLLRESHALSRPSHIIDLRRQAVDDGVRWLAQKGRARLDGARRRLDLSVASLSALDPKAVLMRGYAICRTENGSVVRDVAQASPGDRVTVELRSGRLGCTVDSTVHQDLEGRRHG